ncbi:hypothetical protein PENTCL1PPCAC_23778, partial [Pristionchus entomophagus]
DGDVLEMTKLSALSESTFLYQTDNGTIFYHNAKTSKPSLHVQESGNNDIKDVGLPIDQGVICAIGNYVYYSNTKQKTIFKMGLDDTGVYSSDFFRYHFPCETVHAGGVCSCRPPDAITEGLAVWRIDNEPWSWGGGIALESPAEARRGLELKGVHRKTAIYMKLSSVAIPTVKKIDNDMIVLECFQRKRIGSMKLFKSKYPSWGSPMFAVEESPFVYLSNGKCLFIIDVENMTLRTMHFRNVSSFYIAGIRGSTLLGRGRCKTSNTYHMMTAQLPEEYALLFFPSKFLSEFDIKDRISWEKMSGSFGCVFKVANKCNNLECAVKIIPVNDEDKSSTLTEIRYTSEFDHPGLVRCTSAWIEEPPHGWKYDEGDEILRKGYVQRDFGDGTVFIFMQMELCTSSLENWMGKTRNDGSRTLAQIRPWFEQIVSAVEYIHSNNMTHGNLRPSNILFFNDDHIKIIDLGIKNCIGESVIEYPEKYAEMIMYMSPEQQTEQTHSSKTDVFALGLILVELCLVMSTNIYSKALFEKPLTFDYYRKGDFKIVFDDATTDAFIELLTQIDPNNRPTCREMLEHQFFSQEGHGPVRMMWEETLQKLKKNAKEKKESHPSQSNKPATTQVIEFKSEFATKYYVKKICGEGAFGYVFEAIQNLDLKEYAVKRISVEYSGVERALSEARAMAKLEHPGIVAYKDTWVEKPPDGWQYDADAELFKKIGAPKRRQIYSNDGVFIYIKMQLCHFSLSDWLKEHQAPSSRTIAKMRMWFKQMVSAVDYIHENNLIHRDLKPNNVLFMGTDHVKLCDLGVATERHVDDATESVFSRSLEGTKLYMSPEQRRAEAYSSKTDVFSLGLILAELCVVMTTDMRTEIFSNYRLGKQSELVTDNKTAEFIALLTKVDPKDRPTCSEMLDHLYLA